MDSPPQTRRGGAAGDGVVLNRKWRNSGRVETPGEGQAFPHHLGRFCGKAVKGRSIRKLPAGPKCHPGRS